MSLGNRANDIGQQGVNNQFQVGEERNQFNRDLLRRNQDGPPNTGQTLVTLPQVNFGQNAVGGGSPDEQTLQSPPQTPSVGRTPITMSAPPRSACTPTGSVDQATLAGAARVVLQTMGKHVTDANVKTFIEKNHDALVQQLQGVVVGGGLDARLVHVGG